jgi:hypothetical protein
MYMPNCKQLAFGKEVAQALQAIEGWVGEEIEATGP